MKPLISVLLPTRKRTALVEHSLHSLLSKSRGPEQIEILIAYDDDDQESHDYFTGTAWKKFCEDHGCQEKVYRLPRWGYKELHLYLNFLALMSQGDWLFFWGDDAVMETQDWDDHVRSNLDWFGLLHISASNAPMWCSILPLFPKKWVETFGCVTPVNPADSWITEICKIAKARRVIPVTVLHDRFEDTGNNCDETYHDKKNATGWHSNFHLPVYTEMRNDWAARLKQIASS